MLGATKLPPLPAWFSFQSLHIFIKYVISRSKYSCVMENLIRKNLVVIF